MKIKDAVVFVTGANRGLGRAFAQALLEAGARKVYAAARDPASITLEGVERVKLDVTSAAEVAAAAKNSPDVNLLINNAGITRDSPFLAEGATDAVRAELEANFFGPLALSQAFAPVLKANGGGAIVNVLSALSWITFKSGASATYSASKAAAWSLTNGLRHELRAQGTQVTALHVGLMDTDMTKGIDAPKSAPKDVVRQVLEAIEAGREEVLADEVSRQVKKGLSAEPGAYLAGA
jgi:NAD(P)-dependent dehydrogenase (short-subunit alcohol dehydrogenase family)